MRVGSDVGNGGVGLSDVSFDPEHDTATKTKRDVIRNLRTEYFMFGDSGD
jgi:hypothetical protein